jgi:hypothetical protein
MHIGRIQSSSAVRDRCIISAAARPAEAQMPLAKSPRADAGGSRLTALSIEALALLLRRSGSQHASVEAVRADIAAGAPQNADGTVSLIAYGAWLVCDLARTEGGHAG